MNWQGGELAGGKNWRGVMTWWGLRIGGHLITSLQLPAKNTILYLAQDAGRRGLTGLWRAQTF